MHQIKSRPSNQNIPKPELSASAQRATMNTQPSHLDNKSRKIDERLPAKGHDVLLLCGFSSAFTFRLPQAVPSAENADACIWPCKACESEVARTPQPIASHSGDSVRDDWRQANQAKIKAVRLGGKASVQSRPSTSTASDLTDRSHAF